MGGGGGEDVCGAYVAGWDAHGFDLSVLTMLYHRQCAAFRSQYEGKKIKVLSRYATEM